jgi:DNA mismatch endonuclease, patch repair protein
MPDILTQAQRSVLMAKVRSTGNASTEVRLIAVFRTLGITGWRRGMVVRNAADRRSKAQGPGTRLGERRFQVRPDFVFPKLRLAVFVDGCFWHGCPIHATQPKQNAKFWSDKISTNQARDRLVTRRLRADGWRVLRIWEHELEPKSIRRLTTRMSKFGLPPGLRPAA